MVTSRLLTVAIAGGVASAFLPQFVYLSSPLTIADLLDGLRFDAPAIATPTYIPRRGNTPRRTQGTGSRGCPELPPIALTLLVPSHDDALTTSGHPTFFWHLSSAPASAVEFALVKPGEPTPIFVQQIENPNAGIVQVQMPQDLPELLPGERYRWSVALICNPNRRSADVLAQAWVERVAATPELTSQLEAATSEVQKAEVYAQSGLWYDALTALSAAQTAQPDDQTILEDQLALLEQVGLTEVVEQERQRLASGATTLPN